jgi:cytochrome P450
VTDLPVKVDAGARGAATLSERVFRGLFRGRMKVFAGVPGPPPKVLLGNAGDFIGRKPWEVLSDYHAAYGGLAVFWLVGSGAILVTDPDLVERVLEGDFDRYHKKNPIPALLPILSDVSEFVANGDRWKQDRDNDPMAAAFPPGVCPHAPDGSAPRAPSIDLAPLQAMLEGRARALAQGAAGGPRDLRPAVVRLVFDAITLQLFGTSLDDRAYADYVRLTDAASHRIESSIPSFLSTIGYRPARRRWRARIEAVVAEARQRPDGDDILRGVLRRGTPLSDGDLALSLGASVFGGTQSVSSGILSTLYLVGQDPAIADRIRAEIRALPGGARGASLAAIDACETLDHALLEAIRLYPPAPVYMRDVAPPGPASLGGLSIPAGTTVYLTPWPLHRSRDHWGEDADAFRPARWEGDRKRRDPLGSGWFFPFGRGRRACAGEGLAHVTMKLVLAAIFEAARPVVAEGQPYVPDFYFGVLLPKTMEGRFVMG